MVLDWVKSEAIQKVVGYIADPRPVWLWTGQGERLVWSNPAAKLFRAKTKSKGLKLMQPAVPIRGQVARSIRLGTVGRASLSRIQFLAGKKPISATCTCTPIELDDGTVGLLIVGVDPVDSAIFAEHAMKPDMLKGVFGHLDFIITDEDGALRGSSRERLSTPPAEEEVVQLSAGENLVTVFERVSTDQLDPETDEGEEATAEAQTLADGGDEAELSSMADSSAPEEDQAAAAEEASVEQGAIAEENKDAPDATDPTDRSQRLSQLFDQLMGDTELFTPLGPQDDLIPEGIVVPKEAPRWSEDDVAVELAESKDDERPEGSTGFLADFDPSAEPSDEADAPEEEVLTSEPNESGHEHSANEVKAVESEEINSEPASDDAEESLVEPQTLWKITGQGFTSIDEEEAGTEDDQNNEPEDWDDETADQPVQSVISTEPESTEVTVANDDHALTEKLDEKASRYNFEELSRILTHRVNGEKPGEGAEGTSESEEPVSRPTAALLNLGDETLVLNRLPIGLMIFRDQNIVFANRALTDLVGYPDSASLRAEGISAIFPESESGVGPVTQLQHRDGSRVPVSARLQSITWQGRPAFMLSARHQEVPVSTEAAVRGFAENFANLNGCGFFETSRAGVIDSVSGRAADLLGRSPEVLIGRPLILLAGHEDAAKLRAFLEEPAKFAETSRPGLVFNAIDNGLRITLFAEGQAGIVIGYFGIVERMGAINSAANEAEDFFAPVTAQTSDHRVDASVLRRFSRGMRRPLNTIIGFAELIRSNAFGQIENQRYSEYARDIKFGGQEILDVIDELEDFISLSAGEYPARAENVDLGLLLDRCVVRVRKQAGDARVLVRSAISENLPHIKADEASLTQAILNMLASAIDHTTVGGQVVVSAQREEDGTVLVHVRDSGSTGADLAERFVVFRDGTDPNGEPRKPQPSAVGLALTRSLLAVNTCSLTIDPASGSGTILNLTIPSDLAVDAAE